MEIIRLLILACSMGGNNTQAGLDIQRECQAKLIMCYRLNSANHNDLDAAQRCLTAK